MEEKSRTRRVIVGFVMVLVVLGLIAGAFAAGTLAGRLSARRRAAPPPVVELDNGEEVPELITEIMEGDEGETATPDEGDEGLEPGEEIDDELIREVLNILEDEFYGELPDAKTLAYGAIRGMLMTLEDPYTSFVEPDIADILNEDATGEFEGIGATVQMREDGYLEIVRPLPQHPAEEAGLQAGDLILSVDEQSIVGMGLWEALGLIRGPAGTDVSLEIARPGQEDTFRVTITRARIDLPIVEYEILEGDVAYVQLTEFSATASDLLEEALTELLAENPKGLIFDLRNNPGGYLNQSIAVADLFLDEGLVAIERDSFGNEERFYSYDGDLAEDIPLVVLINGGSASASEIVAGAIRDRERGLLVGEATLGKGSVQLPHNLSDGSQLRVTIARWFTPDDITIHDEGLEPNVEVELPPDTPSEDDPQLDRAIDLILEEE